MAIYWEWANAIRPYNGKGRPQGIARTEGKGNHKGLPVQYWANAIRPYNGKGDHKGRPYEIVLRTDSRCCLRISLGFWPNRRLQNQLKWAELENPNILDISLNDMFSSCM